jgi:hypothetical protein
MIKHIGSKINVQTCFSSGDTLRSRLAKIKPTEPKINKEIVYSIPCVQRGKAYIGEKGCTLEIRVCEHNKSVVKHDPNVSKLTEHVENTGYKFAWDQQK